jgi:hypothetical protein
MCSNSGATANTGSFGWVIPTPNQLIWECIGISTGWNANSFRSEGVGQLALVMFLELYAEYHNLNDIPISLTEPWIRIATDNQGLITRIKD